MPKVTFILRDGSRRTVEARKNLTVMEAAVRNDVPGIVAECGGACACATCQVHVDLDWVAKLPPPHEIEKGMLEFALDPTPNSRLSCQILLTDETDGLVVA